MPASPAGRPARTHPGEDKRQRPAPLGREAFCRAAHVRHPTLLFVRASKAKEARMTTRYRVELSQAERHDLMARLRGGKFANSSGHRFAGCQGVKQPSRRRWPKVPILRSIPMKERSEEHTSELQSLMRISYAGFC